MIITVTVIVKIKSSMEKTLKNTDIREARMPRFFRTDLDL